MCFFIIISNVEMQRGPFSSLDSVTSLPHGQYQPPHPLLCYGRPPSLPQGHASSLKGQQACAARPSFFFQIIPQCCIGFRSRDVEGHGSTKLPRLARCSPSLCCGAVVLQGQLLLGGKQRHDSNVDDLIHEKLIITCSLNKKKHITPLALYRFAFICVYIMFFSPERIANKALFLVLSPSFKTLHTHGDLKKKCLLRLLKTLLISLKYRF